MGLGLDQGLLQQKAITDRTGSAAMAAPISGEGLNPPAELLGRTADGAISTTGTAMEQQMHQPAASARQKLSGNALMGPGQITAAAGRDHKRPAGGHFGPG